MGQYAGTACVVIDDTRQMTDTSKLAKVRDVDKDQIRTTEPELADNLCILPLPLDSCATTQSTLRDVSGKKEARSEAGEQALA